MIAFSVISNVFVKHPNALLKFECDINASAAATVYVQLHDARVLPGNGAVPLKSWPAPAGTQDFYKEFKSGEMDFKYGIVAVVSTTQATLTVGTGSNKFDSVVIELEDPDYPSGTSYAGDEAIAINTLQVWAEASGPKVLYRIIVSELLGVAGYIWIMADDAGTKSALGGLAGKPFPIAASAVGVVIDFGANDSAGFSPFEKDANGTTHVGCTVIFANSATDFTNVSANKGTIEAEYK